MADKKISQLTSGNPAQAADELPARRSGDNFKITAGSIANLAVAGLATVATTGSYSDLTGQPSIPTLYANAQTLVVDVDGNNSTGDGSANKPYATIQAAVDAAAANYTSGEHVMIQVMPGNYAGNVTITRPRTHVIGFGDGVTKLVRNSGNITINQTAAAVGVSEDIYTFANMLLVAGSGDIFTLAGTARYSFFARNVYCYSDTASARCLNVTNTSTGGIKVDYRDGLLQNENSTVPVVDFNNTYFGIFQRNTVYAGASEAMKITTSSVFVTLSDLQTVSGTDLISVVSGFGTQFNPISAPTGSVALSIGNSLLSSAATNGNGINIALGATASAAINAFSVRAGTGFAVKGVAGSFFINGQNVMVPGTNVKVSTAMGAGNIPYTTSFTAA
jgi:hypothetical protein